ncbi:hypothetical protein IWQ54_001158 [Labrenzia sp. EL_195]|nr:hypothetical protein [Labrenzia sp. EL_195]
MSDDIHKKEFSAAHDAFERMRKAHERGTGCRLTARMQHCFATRKTHQTGYNLNLAIDIDLHLQRTTAQGTKSLLH